MFGNKKADSSLTPKDEEFLMLKIKNAEGLTEVQREFNSLYDSLCNKLWGKLFKKFVPPFDIDGLKDVFQEGWRKVLEKRDNYAENNNVYNWIYTILNNTAIDVLRKEKISDNNIEKNPGSFVYSNKSGEEDSDKMERIPMEDKNIDEEISSEETVAIIMEAIEAIEDDTDRMLIKLRIVEGMKYNEIAQETGMKLSTVHYRVDKEMDRLRPKLKKLLFD
jgi:RNA polymerase sigma factor (sigma-70 family)